MKPFLRWAGGKNWLVKHIDSIIDVNRYNNYHEPFVGGGSMYFHLGMPNQCYLSDVNENLIGCYLQVRDNVELVIEVLATYQNTKDFYYELRPQIFNDPVQRAAQFIYLNQTSYNGIYRVNLDGVYNVPYGYRTKDFLQSGLLREASTYLEGARIEVKEFDADLDEIAAGDLVFLDPPYTITHNDNGFIKYNERLFSENDQYRLAEFIKLIVDAGAYYVLTNAAHHDIARIFDMNIPLVMNRASLIGGKNALRGNYEEFLFTNIENEFIVTNR
ncbi:MAG: Dam family site-specific DNA-(adenine-N6)-methyltransferase [Cyclobacteriaceae bacterium]